MPALGIKNGLGRTSIKQSAVVRAAKGLSAYDSYSVSFDGTSDYIDFSTNFSSIFQPDSDWGIAAWVKVGNLGGTDYIFSAGSVTGSGSYVRFMFGIDSDNYLETTHQSANDPATVRITGDDAVPEDTWTLVTTSHNSSTNTITQSVGSNTHSGTWAPSGNINGVRGVFGSLSQTISSNELTGSLASVAFFNDEITSSNRTSMLTSSGFDMSSLSHCVHWWRMGDGVGDATPPFSYQDPIVDQVGDEDGELRGDTLVVSGAIE